MSETSSIKNTEEKNKNFNDESTNFPDDEDDLEDSLSADEIDRSQVPIVEEMVERRTANEKHFRKLDGSYEVVLYNQPVHYLENNEWKDINNSFIDSGDSFENIANSFKVKLPKNIHDAKGVNIQLNNYEISGIS